MHFLDLILFLGPLPHLLIFHQFSSEVETGLVGNWWKGVVKPSPLPVQLDIVKNIDGGRQPIAVRKVLQGQYLWFFPLPVNFLWGVWVGLALRLPVVSLDVDLLGCGLF